jgi:hypothetical protein
MPFVHERFAPCGRNRIATATRVGSPRFQSRKQEARRARPRSWPTGSSIAGANDRGVAADGTIAGIERFNGIDLSPDGARLYVADSADDNLYPFPPSPETGSAPRGCGSLGRAGRDPTPDELTPGVWAAPKRTASQDRLPL